MNPHRHNELQSIRLHEAIGERLKAEPEVLQKAWRAIERDRTSDDYGTRQYAERWAELITACGTMNELAERIIEDTESMRALRQNTPFRGVLAPRERERVLRDFRRERAGRFLRTRGRAG